MLRFMQRLKMLRPSRSPEARGRSPTLPPETDPGVSVRRMFLGSTLEFMQREYLNEWRQNRVDGKGI
jgi:hypothetical protein